MSSFSYRGGYRSPWRPSIRSTTSQRAIPAASKSSVPELSARYGRSLREISITELSAEIPVIEEARITDCKVLASYNWTEKSEASIIVPGMPPRWTPLSSPVQLREDSGTYYRDLNAARCPDHPLGPAIRAILEVNSEADKATSTGEVDLFGCSSTLGNLLRFVRGSAPRFRIVVEVVGSTVHLVRREASPLEVIPNVRGYGHTFPESYTTWDPEVAGSSSHHRVLSYKLGAVSCFCLFEGDGYFPMKSGDEKAEGKRGERTASLSDYFSGALSSTLRSPYQGMSSLKMTRAGVTKTQESLFELKTRSVKYLAEKDAMMEAQLPRLWLRQVPNFVLAYHSSGTFNDIKILDVRDELIKWEEENADAIAKYITLLRRIVDFARGMPEGRLEITFDEGASSLHIRSQVPDMPPLLPRDMAEKWKAWLSEANQSRSCNEDAADSDTSFHVLANDELRSESETSQRSFDYTACDRECGYCGQCKY